MEQIYNLPIVVAFSSFEGKVGVAVGVTNELTKKYDAVSLVKIASEVLGGKGGGGRKDFAQAGGQDKNKIDVSSRRIPTARALFICVVTGIVHV